MDIIRILTGGFPTDGETFDFLRDSTKAVVEGLSLMAGDSPLILEGVVELNGAVSDGIILFKRELFPFKASALQSTVTIKEEIEQVPYNEDLDNDQNLDLKEGYIKRFAECGVGGVDSFNFSELKRIPSLSNVRVLGEVVDFVGQASSIPNGWMLADGSSLLKADYPDLYAVLGNLYGSTTTTFRLPDFRNRMSLGAGSTYSLGNKAGSTNASGNITIPRDGWANGENTSGGTSGRLIVSTGNPENAENLESLSKLGASRSVSGSSLSVLNPYIAMNKIIYVGIK